MLYTFADEKLGFNPKGGLDDVNGPQELETGFGTNRL